ncbi:MAG: hypothetical protein ACK5YR_23280 [Pirellula sp.]
MSTIAEPENKVVVGELIDTRLSNAPIVFHVSDAKIDELKRELSGLKIIDSADYAKVTKGIGVCRTLRVQIEKCRKDLKEDSLAYGRRVDAEAKRLTVALEAIEEPLKAEKARIDEEKELAKKKVEEAKRLKLEARLNELSAINARVNPLVVADWTDEEFQTQFEVAKGLFEAGQRQSRIEAERLAKEEAERQEALRLEREKLEAERAELARLRTEQEAAAKAERDRIEAEQAAERKRLDEERAKIEEAQRIERERIEAEKAAIQAEKDRLAREQFERDEAERLKREEEERAEQERLELIRAEEERKEAIRLQEIAEQEELARQEALRPDKEKICIFADVLTSLDLPAVESDEAMALINVASDSLMKIAEFLRAFGEPS